MLYSGEVGMTSGSVQFPSCLSEMHFFFLRDKIGTTETGDIRTDASACRQTHSSFQAASEANLEEFQGNFVCVFMHSIQADFAQTLTHSEEHVINNMKHI